MALQGDGTGSVSLGTRTASGDFSVIFSSATLNNPANPEIIIGDGASGNSFLAIFSGPVMSGRANGTTIAPGYNGSLGESIKIEMFRTGSTGGLRVNDVLLNNAVGVGVVSLDNIFSFNGGTLIGNMLLSGTLSMVGFSGGESLYNFEGSGTTLIDSISSVNGVLSGFTTGGFTGVINGISIESVVDDQARQRDSNNQAEFTIAGSLTGSTPTTISYSFNESDWFILDSSPTSTTFTGSVTVTNQQTVFVRRDDDVSVIDSALRLKASPCIGIAPAQSNGVSTIINEQPLNIGQGNPTPAMYKNGVYSILEDPTGINLNAGSLGSLWPYIAERYSDIGVPICLGNVALSSSTIASWDPALANYSKLAEFATDCGGLEFVISLIGETDSFNGTSTAAFKAAFLTTAQHTFDTYGAKTYAVYFPVGTGTGTTPNVNAIRLAYDELVAENDFIEFGGDLSAIDISSATNPLNDDLHIRLDADATTASEIIWNTITPGVISTAAFQISPPLFSIQAGPDVTPSSASLSFSIDSPVFLISGGPEVSSPVANISFSIRNPSFSVESGPVITDADTDISFSINPPEFSVAGGPMIPPPSASVNFEIAPPSFIIRGGPVITPQAMGDIFVEYASKQITVRYED